MVNVVFRNFGCIHPIMQAVKKNKKSKKAKAQGIWGSDGLVPVPEIVKTTDEYIAPVIIKKQAVSIS